MGGAVTQRRVREVLGEYERALAGAPLSAQSRRAYRSRVAGYLRWLTGTAPVAGDPLDDPAARDRAVRAYRSYLMDVQDARPTTVNAVLAALDDFYRQIRLGPVEIGREEVPAGVRRALPEDQRRHLLSTVDRQAPPRDRAILYTLLYTGVRVAELVALDLPDLRLAGHQSRLWVPGSARRELPLGPPPRPVLRAWIDERQGWRGADRAPALFLNRRGGRLSTRWVDQLVAELGRAAGLAGETRLTPQVLRSTFGADQLRAGADLARVTTLLGHTRTDTTRRHLREGSGTAPDGRAGAERATNQAGPSEPRSRMIQVLAG